MVQILMSLTLSVTTWVWMAPLNRLRLQNVSQKDCKMSVVKVYLWQNVTKSNFKMVPTLVAWMAVLYVVLNFRYYESIRLYYCYYYYCYYYYYYFYSLKRNRFAESYGEWCKVLDGFISRLITFFWRYHYITFVWQKLLYSIYVYNWYHRQHYICLTETIVFCICL